VQKDLSLADVGEALVEGQVADGAEVAHEDRQQTRDVKVGAAQRHLVNEVVHLLEQQERRVRVVALEEPAKALELLRHPVALGHEQRQDGADLGLNMHVEPVEVVEEVAEHGQGLEAAVIERVLRQALAKLKKRQQK